MPDNELFTLASKIYDIGNYEEAFKLFLQCASEGDIDAMCHIASMYTCGEGVICDYDKAIEWELKAIKHGSTSALFNAGVTCRIKGDINNSKYWFEKALHSGDGEAALQLAKLYMVSDKETNKVKEYLTIAIGNEHMCEDSVGEAKSLLDKINP